MGKLVILQLPEGDFQRGFSCTVQIGLDGGTIENFAQITGRLPANPDMPQKLNDEWRRAFNFNESSRIKAKQAGVTNFSKSNAVNNFVEYLNNWLNNSTESEWQKIRDFLQQSLNKEEEIRVIIQTQVPILRRIPWQAWNLFAENYPSSEIALSPTTFATPGDLPASNSNKVRILVVLGSSTVADGSQEIDITFDQQELEKLKQQGAFLKFLKQPDPQELRDCLWLEEGWDIFFFAGHSSSSDDGKIGEIILNNAHVEGLKITELFEALKKAISRGLQLAIFNSCDGLGLANKLAELNIGQMIVMREPVPDAVAKTFLKHFLTALACNNQSLYASVREARLRLEDFNEQYPGTKYLPVICQNSAVTPPNWEKLRTKRRIHWADWDTSSHMTYEEYQERHMLTKVKNFWVKNVLEASLCDRILLEIKLEERPDAVNHPCRLAGEILDLAKQTLPPGTRVIDKFDQMGIGRTLLILGEPGSGKTTALLDLARNLIYRAENDDKQLIPVVFNLSSWGRGKLHQSVTDWLLQELNQVYLVSKKLGRNWIKEQKLLLLLDGLDEVKEEYCRNSFVEALNRFCQKYKQTEIIITSSLSYYDRLSYPLDFQSAIYLQTSLNQSASHVKPSHKQFLLWKYLITGGIAVIFIQELLDSLIIALFVYISLWIIFTPISFVLKIQSISLASPIATFINSLYLLPPLSIILCSQLPILSLYLPNTIWLIITIYSFYISFKSLQRVYIPKNISVLSWIKSWIGWSLSKHLEPSKTEKISSLVKTLSLSWLTIFISFVDMIAKFWGLSITAYAPIAQLLLVAGSFGATIYTLTATDEETHSFLGRKKVFKFTRIARLISVLTSIIAMIIWIVIASQEVQGDLQIATATIPKPWERTMSVTLVNRGKSVRILKEFHVESKTSLSFNCTSIGFDIPLAGEYKLPFHIGEPLTIIKAEPEKQFRPETPGRIELLLKPGSGGKCADTWKAMVRFLVVSDDGRRSGTDWFKLTGK